MYIEVVVILYMSTYVSIHVYMCGVCCVSMQAEVGLGL